MHLDNVIVRYGCGYTGLVTGYVTTSPDVIIILLFADTSGPAWYVTWSSCVNYDVVVISG